MVSFTDYYNAISIDKDFSSATKTFLFLLKTQKKTSTAAMDRQYLKVEVADQDFPNCSYVINRTCHYLMLIMQIKSIKNRKY